MRRLVASFVLLGAILAARTPAHADTLTGTRFDMTEVAHDITVRVDRGFATLLVQRTFKNPGPIADQAVVMVDVPALAVATGLRTRSDSGQWFDGELMDAEDAAKKYRELTGLGGAYPKDPALLSWRHQGLLELQVFPVTAKRDKTVEYTFTLPLSYDEGVFKAHLPAIGSTHRNAVLRFAPAREGDVVRVNGVPVASGVRFESKTAAEIELVPRGDVALAGQVSTQALENGRSLFRAHFEVPRRLSKTPEGAAVAVVVDTSRSMAHGDASSTALFAARAYLSHFARASVTVVTFNRKVETPFGVNVPVQDALASLARYEPKLGNGSEVEAALLRADAAVAASPSAVKRIVVITDLETRRGIDPETFAKLPLKSGALVHLSTVRGGDPTRDDESPWAELPRRTGGLLWHAGGGTPSSYEQWARPMSIDNAVLHGLPADAYPSTMYLEGTSYEHFAVRTGAGPSDVSLDGELWSKKVHVGFASSPAEDKRTAALAFGHSVMHSLTEPEQRILAMRGGAVSPVTSYLAIEPGVRPSTEGLEPAGVGMGGGGRGYGVGCGMGVMPPLASLPAMRAALSTAVDAAWERCVGHGKLTVETGVTFAELVEISAVAEPRDMKAESCVAEQLWQLELDESIFHGHGTFTLVANR